MKGSKSIEKCINLQINCLVHNLRLFVFYLISKLVIFDINSHAIFENN